MEENKIISFKSRKERLSNNRRHNNYKLKHSFTFSIFESGNNTSFKYSYSKELSMDSAFKIIYEIYLKAARLNAKAEFQKKELLNTNFTILYYEKNGDPKDFKFICTPKISDSKLAAILWIIINNA